jgi:hypothetical protein
MLIGQSPFHGDGEDELFDAILNERPYFPKWIGKEAAKILSAVFKKFLIQFIHFLYFSAFRSESEYSIGNARLP